MDSHLTSCESALYIQPLCIVYVISRGGHYGRGEHFGLSAAPTVWLGDSLNWGRQERPAQTVRWGDRFNWGRQDGLAQTVLPRTVWASLCCPCGQYGLTHTVQGDSLGKGQFVLGHRVPLSWAEHFSKCTPRSAWSMQATHYKSAIMSSC